MDKIKILIVEDELITAQATKLILEGKGYSITDIVSSEQKVFESILRSCPDIILMDIHLHGKIEGIKIAQNVKKIHPIPIIYLTNLSDQQIFAKAKETFPQNYITKPFTKDTLVRAIELAINNHKIIPAQGISTEGKDFIFIPGDNNKFHKIWLSHILFIEADGAYSQIYFDSGNNAKPGHITVAIASNRVLEQLPPNALYKVHRSYHVNIDKISAVVGNTIFINDIKIPVSKEHQDELFNHRLVFLKQKSVQK